MVRLTQTIQKGGCAAKVAAHVLREILSEVELPPKQSEILVDGGTFDDAAVIKIDDRLSLVQTLDFFTPIVDTPYLFGQIAAANAISDVYAMGGLPKTALAILAFPVASFEPTIVRDVLRGSCERIGAAGASLVGGHTIDDETLKFGLSVTGYVATSSYWTNAGAKVGDRLILTKPLGTGTLAAGLKRGVYTEEDIGDALASMTNLNDVPAVLGAACSVVNAATDITGFGLAGHAMQLARESRVTLEIDIKQLPLFERTLESLEREHLTKAHRTNREYVGETVSFDNLTPLQELITLDPQTSGGLLLSVPEGVVDSIKEKLSKRFVSTKVIGVVVERGERLVAIRN